MLGESELKDPASEKDEEFLSRGAAREERAYTLQTTTQKTRR